MRSSFSAQSRSLAVFLASFSIHDPYAFGSHGHGLQLSSWRRGARGGFRHGCLLFPLSWAVVILAPPGHPGDLAVCNLVSWGFPQNFALSGLQATREHEMKGTVHTYGDWNALSLNLVMWRPIHESNDEWWVPGIDPLIGFPPGTGFF